MGGRAETVGIVVLVLVGIAIVLALLLLGGAAIVALAERFEGRFYAVTFGGAVLLGILAYLFLSPVLGVIAFAVLLIGVIGLWGA